MLGKMEKTVYAANNEQATSYLKQHQGENIKNISDGTIARYGSVGRNKMISNKAREKSLKNGFSPQEHSTAAANVVVLYEYSHMIIERPDRKGNTDVTIRYYETAIEFIPSCKCGWAQIMMKMSNIEGNTLYTIELVGIKNKPDLIDEPLSKEAIRASDPIVKLPSEL